MSQQECNKCGKIKPIDEYYFFKKTNKYSPMCIECKSAADKEYYEKNKDKIKAGVKKYAEENPEKIKEQNKKYYEENFEVIAVKKSEYQIEHKEELKEYNQKYREENAEEIAAKKQEYREENKDIVKLQKQKYYNENREEILKDCKEYRDNNKEEKQERDRQYYINNTDKIKESIKNYQETHKEEVNANKRVYKKKRKEEDPIYKTQCNISAAFRSMIKSAGLSKNGRSYTDILCYYAQELKEHLESLFEPWMTWNNWGVYNAKTWDDNDQSTWTWNIDHIKPISHFIIISLDDPQLKECWALSNLRPYSAKLNVIENDRR